MISRKNDRKHAFCVIFQRSFGIRAEALEDLEYYLENFAEEKMSEPDFVLNEIQGVFDNLANIDKHIEETSSAWDITRISKVDLAIMRLAVYEILYMDKIVPAVSINEAVELAKTYSTEDSRKFVNGVLGKIVKGLEVAE